MPYQWKNAKPDYANCYVVFY